MENEKRSINAERRVKKVSLKSLIWKVPILVVGIFLAFLIFLSLVLTFNFTKSILLNFALNIANNSFNGKVSFEGVDFNPFSGIVLNNVLISLNSDTIAYANKILLDWDWEPIFQRNVLVKKIVLYNPRVNLIKDFGDTLWNYQKFFKSSKNEKPESKTNLRLVVKNFELKNGTFKLVDKNHQSNANYFDPNNLWLSNANVKLSAEINLSTEKYSLVVKEISLAEKHSNLSLEKLSAKLEIDSSGFFIKDLVVKTTHSNVLGSVEYLNANSAININLNESIINTTEIKKFSDLPISSNIPLKLDGKIVIGDNIEFKSVSVNLGSKSFFAIDGLLRTSSVPDVELQISNLQVYEKELRRTIPEFLGDLDINFGYISSKRFYFLYQNHNISLRGDFISKPAKFKTEFIIDSQKVMHYKVDFQNVDLAYFLQKFPKTNITGKSQGVLTISDLENLNGNLSLDVSSGKLDLKGFDDFKIFIASNIRNGVIYIDTLNFTHLNNAGDHQIGYILGDGKVDISRKLDVSYTFNLFLNSLRLNSFFEEPNYLPEKVTGRFQFEGKRFDLNSMYLDLKAQVDEFAFPDKSVLPFYIKVNINHLDTANKYILIESDILRGNIKGNYNLLSLIDNFSSQFTSIAMDLEHKFENVIQNKNDGTVVNSSSKNLPISQKPPVTKSYESVKANFHINDFSILGMFLKTNLAFSGNISLNLTSTPQGTNFELDTFYVGYFSLKDENKRVDISNFSMQAKYEIYDSEDILNLHNLFVNGSTKSRVILGDSYFDYFDINLNYSEDKLKGQISTTYSTTTSINIDFDASFSDSLININLNKLLLFYDNIFQWSLVKPVSFALNSQCLAFDDFTLARENAERINLTGIYYFNDSVDLSLYIYGIPLNDIQKILPLDNNFSKIKNFTGEVDTIKLYVQNFLENPNISLKLMTSDLSFDNFELGSINAGFHYDNGNLFGKCRLTNKSFSPLDIELIEIPIKINLGKALFSLSKDKEFRAFINCDRFNLSLLNPLLLDFVEGLQGSFSISTIVQGFLPEDLRFNGTVDIFESSFTPLANNLRYDLSGKIHLKDTEYLFDNLIIKNAQNDFPDGSGKISGKVLFSNNRLHRFEASLLTDGLKVLSNASVKSIPRMYGDLVVSTMPNGLRFVFEKNEMLLNGNINFLRGKLYMPGSSGGSGVSESFVQYEISGSKKDDTVNSKFETLAETKQPTNFKIDIFLKFLEPIELTLDLATIGQIYAIISLANNSSSLRFYYDPQNDVTLLTGNDLVLREGSTLKFVKLFNTEGSISFPTGAIDNPGLNLKAYYNGQSIYNDVVRNFTVTIYITGTKEKPNLRFDYTIDGQPAVDDSSKIAQDAIFLLAFGKTKSEIEKSGISGGFNLYEVSTSGSSALLSKIVTDALSGTGFISSADIVLPPSASIMDKATLKLGGRFLGMSWNFGGTMADLLNNNELSVEIPIGTVLPFNLPNIILQLSKSSSLTQSVQRTQKDWEIKLKYGSNW